MILENVKEVGKMFGNPKNSRIGNLRKERNLKKKAKSEEKSRILRRKRNFEKKVESEEKSRILRI